jgi:hypothetical protein
MPAEDLPIREQFDAADSLIGGNRAIERVELGAAHVVGDLCVSVPTSSQPVVTSPTPGAVSNTLADDAQAPSRSTSAISRSKLATGALMSAITMSSASRADAIRTGHCWSAWRWFLA